MLFLVNPASATFEKSAGLHLESSVQETLVNALVASPADRGVTDAPEASFLAGEEVRLLEDIPDVWLRVGDVGVVISMWCSPIVAYEVEFHQPDRDCQTRVIVFPDHLTAAYDGDRSDHL